VAFEVASPEIRVAKYRLEDFSWRWSQRDNHVSQCDARARFYEGDINLAASADLLEDDIPAKISLRVQDLDLAAWRKDHPIKNRHLAGKLSLTAELQGPLKKLDQITGQGAMTIKDGYLGRLIKIYPDVFFTDAQADFIIRDQKVLTENGQVLSQGVGFHVKGWIDIHRNLYADIVPLPDNVPAATDGSLRIDPSRFLHDAISLQCNGTIKKPNCRPKASPVKFLQNTIDNTKGLLFNSVGEILNELF